MKHKETADISKSAWMMNEQAKTNVAQNVTKAVASGQLKIDRALLPLLLTVLNGSIDQGYHQALPQFEQTVEKALDAASGAAKKAAKKA